MSLKIRELSGADFHNHHSATETLIPQPYDRTIIQYMLADPEKPRYHTTQAKVVVPGSGGNELAICVAGGTVDSKNGRVKHCSFTIPVPANHETIFAHFWQGGWPEGCVRRFEYRFTAE